MAAEGDQAVKSIYGEVKPEVSDEKQSPPPNPMPDVGGPGGPDKPEDGGPGGGQIPRPR